MSKTRRRVKSLGLIAVLALVLGACGDGTAETTAGPSTTAAPTETTEAAPETTAAPTETTEAASTEPVRIGLLTDLTGFTPWAVQAQDGFMLAAQEINDAGGIDGRIIEIVVQDSEND